MPYDESVKGLVKRYFDQQKDVYGDGFCGPEHLEKLKKTMPEEKTDQSKKQALLEFDTQINTCQKCALGSTRTKFVFGVGNPDADIMFIGEAPGQNEDQQGEPFVGRAGKLLDKILESIGLNREIVYIANILKCRPPGNRDPLPAEVDLCEPYLIKQIEIIEPKLIVALGRIAAHTLLKSQIKLGDLRLKTLDYHGTDLRVTYHPAALLRNPAFKHNTWEDMKEIKRLYLDN